MAEIDQPRFLNEVISTSASGVSIEAGLLLHAGVVLVDLKDFEFSETVDILETDGVLHTLVKDLHPAERYSYVCEGNSQVLDQILFSPNLDNHFPHDYDVAHVNSEFADAIQASDHEPSLTRIDLRGRPTPKP